MKKDKQQTQQHSPKSNTPCCTHIPTNTTTIRYAHTNIPIEKQRTHGIRTEAEDEKSAYERILYSLHHDTRWMKEVSLGRRVGFYRFRGDLGHGNFSVVKLAQHQLTRDKVAIKVIEKSKLDQKTHRMLSREISNMDLIGHPNVIRLFEVVETLSRIHLVMEFASGGELYNKIINHGHIEENEAKRIFSQIFSAIAYLHSISIVHRDIKAENVFMMSDSLVKLGDFGFSIKVSQHKEHLATFCGSPPYAAPELYKDESYNGPAVDVWALGVLMFFVLTSDMPFKAATVIALKRQILAGSFNIPMFLSEAARNMIGILMKPVAQERPEAKEILSLPWFYGAEVINLDPLPEYMIQPRLQEPPESLSEEEDKAYKQMKEWGLSKSNLTGVSQLGARSSIVGTYRILLHRIFNWKSECELHCSDSRRLSVSDGHSGRSTPSESKSQKSSCTSSPIRSKFKLIQRISKCNHHKKRSKRRSCSIL